MIVKEIYKIPAALTVEKDKDNNIINRRIAPAIDELTDPVLSFVVKEKIWVDDKMYLNVEIVYDESDRDSIIAKGWEKLTK